jgi:hypothetical protein
MSWDEIARKEKQRIERAERRAKSEADRLNAIAERAKSDAEFRVLCAERAKVDAENERQRWVQRTLRVLNRGLLDVLIHEPHHRGKNWVAIVAVDPTMPGGLSRVFFDRARPRGPAKYIVPERLEAGNVLEFGADYITSVGKAKPNRAFAFVLSTSETAIEIQPYRTYEEAIDHRLVRVG